MIRIIIKKVPTGSRLFDRMPLPNVRRVKQKVAGFRKLEIGGKHKFVRRVSKISA